MAKTLAQIATFGDAVSDHYEEWEMPCGESVWGDGRDAGDHEVDCPDCQAITRSADT